MPLNKEKTQYYVNNKANGVPITGTYTLDGVQYTCDLKFRCNALMDAGRGRFFYQTSWVWGTLLTTLLETGEVFTLNLIYGFGGIDQPSEMRFSEDFLTLNGKHYKLDQTKMFDFVPKDIKQHHYFRTIEVDERVYPSRGCDVVFTPFTKGEQSKDGAHLSIVSFTQNFLFGTYAG